MDLKADFRSDTLTRPTLGMLDAMHSAKTGDDVFAEDLTTEDFQQRCAQMFGHEAALFCPSGTMTNQIAINVHVQPGDEVVCDRMSHIYNYEGGGIARNSGASVRLLRGDHGRFKWEDVAAEINPSDSHYARTSLVSLEDTCNRGGGSVWKLSDIQSIREGCDASTLPLHLDGARCWNAMVARAGDVLPSAKDWQTYGRLFDSISVCFSKGLGAPVGSVLIGSKDFIAKAHRSRKVFGGGMRQIGVLTAACNYALNNELPRLHEDHKRAKQIGNVLIELSRVVAVDPVETNIVIFEIADGLTAAEFVKTATQDGILCFAFGPQRVRMVVHRDLNQAQVDATCEALSRSVLNH
ncbi:MAG TPA: threonine aldolase [Flavobacteriales bacterium]|nr:threonine aldolase [Flavobacteriales bacterium]|tara:strand:+ start:93 stop:1148 length:1056 start_codon:yes stop_codon:yes gene_type:complete